MKENLFYITKKEMLLEKDDRSAIEKTIENILLLVGFVPLVGEIADFVLICYYLYRKEYLLAALTAIALIPTVGDVIAYPVIKVVRGLKSAPKNAQQLAKIIPEQQMGKVVQMAGHPKVQASANQIANVNNSFIRKLGLRFKSFLNDFSGYGGRIVKNIADPDISRPVSRAIKDWSREKSLATWLKKNTNKTEKDLTGFWKFWILRWKPHIDRRKFVKSFIFTNNLLKKFSVSDEDEFYYKLQNDKNFANRVANDPSSLNLVGSTLDVSELNRYTGVGQGLTSGMGGVFGLFLIKSLASKFVP